jgi:hypothetical protein
LLTSCGLSNQPLMNVPAHVGTSPNSTLSGMRHSPQPSAEHKYPILCNFEQTLDCVVGNLLCKVNRN